MQQLNPSEISDLIKQRIDQLEVASQATNEGTIVSVTDGIIRIHGLTEVQYGEMIDLTGGLRQHYLEELRVCPGCGGGHGRDVIQARGIGHCRRHDRSSASMVAF